VRPRIGYPAFILLWVALWLLDAVITHYWDHESWLHSVMTAVGVLVTGTVLGLLTPLRARRQQRRARPDQD